MRSVPGAVATGLHHITRMVIAGILPVATAPGTDLITKVGTLTQTLGIRYQPLRVLVLILRCMILYTAFPSILKVVAHLFDPGVGMHFDIHLLACGLLPSP